MPKRPKDLVLDDLNETQVSAVTHGEGPLLIVAGAGSGKTRVITRRVAYLVREGVQPRRTIAITFTNKAADEMRRRIEALVGRDATVLTFHAFCAWLLRREIHQIGWDSAFSIYDRPDSARVVRQLIDDMELDRETFRPADVLDRIGLHKDRLETPDQCAQAASSETDKTIAEVFRRYNERLAESNALDFDDLLVKTIDLFNARPDVLRAYQDRYLHVLVDEYQDTNLPQHWVARALQGKHHNITAVGDPDQMIYTWRGARLENTLDFERDFPGADIIKLERNYRSTANILHAASTCVSFNKLRHEKVLWTDSEPGEPVHVAQFLDAYGEAEYIAQAIEELTASGVPVGEMAVLYRTKYQSLQLEEAFAERTVAYQVVDTVGFFDRREVKDLRAYIQVLVNSRDDAALERIVNVPARGIGKKTVEVLRGIAQQQACPLLHAARRAEKSKALSRRATKALQNFSELYERLAAIRADTVYAFLKQLIKELGYVESLPAENRESAREILDYFLGYAKQYDKRHPGADLTGFMEHTALISDVDGWDAGAKAVSMMTLHSAKGLEFDVVFISGVEEGILPHQRALEDDGYGQEDYALEEERRLLHVGMTRARKRLYLTLACRRMIRGQEQPVMPSRFVQELPEQGVTREGLQAPPAPDAPKATRRKRLPTAGVKPSSKRKGPLQLAEDATDGFTKGARVTHASYGEGVVVALDAAGKHQLVRVKFANHGVLTILVPMD